MTFSSASAPSAAIITSQKGSRPLATRSRTMGLSSATSSLTVLPEAALISWNSGKVFRAATVIPALPASLLQQVNSGDLYTFIKGFTHVVDREGGTSNGNQRFHLHACLRCGRNPGNQFHPIFA